MFFYREIVFGLKHKARLPDFPKLLELFRSRNMIIAEHNSADEYCERPGHHFHGIIEYETDEDLNQDFIFQMLKKNCTYLKSKVCNTPQEFVANLIKAPKVLKAIEIVDSANLRNYFAVDSRYDPEAQFLELNQYDRELDFNMIIEFIMKEGIINPEIIFDRFKSVEFFCFLPDKEFTDVVEKCISLANQSVMDETILELCCNINTGEESFSVERSAVMVLDWCRFQNIDVERFVMDWIDCLNKNINQKNTLYFHGAPECGAAYIVRSIMKACIFVGQIIEETTGFEYVWQDCIDKRLIWMTEPAYDESMFETLLNVLEGKGTRVPYAKREIKYLRRTPVVITACSHGWENEKQASFIKSRLVNSYTDLEDYKEFQSCLKELHPGWLNRLVVWLNGTPGRFGSSLSLEDMDQDEDSEL